MTIDWKTSEQSDVPTAGTTVTRVNGALYQARELASEVCQIVEMFIGPQPPTPSLVENKTSPERMTGIFHELDENADDTKSAMDRAFQAIKRLRSSV